VVPCSVHFIVLTLSRQPSVAAAFAGLVAVPPADMQIRDIGIVGYVVRLPMAAVLMAILFGRPQAGDLRLQLGDPLIAIRDQRGHVGGFETLRDMLRTIGIPGMEVE
jgi:hypothetical protein